MKKSTTPIPEKEIRQTLPDGKKIYFLSDIHLGAPVLVNNREREQILVEWLENIRPECGILFLLGDIFDFWFEYKRVVPKGYIRFLAKICEFTDEGIPVHFFTLVIMTFGLLTIYPGNVESSYIPTTKYSTSTGNVF